MTHVPVIIAHLWLFRISMEWYHLRAKIVKNSLYFQCTLLWRTLLSKQTNQRTTEKNGFRKRTNWITIILKAIKMSDPVIIIYLHNTIFKVPEVWILEKIGLWSCNRIQWNRLFIVWLFASHQRYIYIIRDTLHTECFSIIFASDGQGNMHTTQRCLNCQNAK